MQFMANRRKLLLIAVLMTVTIKCLAVTVEKTANLNVYYPEYTRIDLVCGQMPKTSQSLPYRRRKEERI